MVAAIPAVGTGRALYTGMAPIPAKGRHCASITCCGVTSKGITVLSLCYDLERDVIFRLFFRIPIWVARWPNG